jgi:hypothetical protein
MALLFEILIFMEVPKGFEITIMPSVYRWAPRKIWVLAM